MNSHQLKALLLLIFSAFLLNFCEKASPGLTEIPEPSNLLDIYPDRGTVGTRLSIVGVRFDSIPARNAVYFANSAITRTDSVKNGFLFATIPLLAASGQLTVIVRGDTFFTEPFELMEECADSSICLLPFDLNSEITESSSLFFGHDGGWNVEVKNDTVTIFATVSWGTWQTGFIFNFLDKTNSDLPNLINVVFTYEGGDPGIGTFVVDTLQHGIVKIQDWDLNDVVSGRIFAREGTLDFWYDFTP